MTPAGKEGINIVERLEASNRKLTETLLEIVRPVNLADLPNPYDCEKDSDEMGYVGESRIPWSSVEGVAQIQERRDTTELGELRRRLFIAERAGCGKLADMWRRQIGQLDQKDFEAHQEGSKENG